MLMNNIIVRFVCKVDAVTIYIHVKFEQIIRTIH